MASYTIIISVSLAVMSDFVDSKVFFGKVPQTPVLSHAAGLTDKTAQETAARRRQEIMAVPPVTTSILHGPYLPPADADNQVFLAPHGIANPLHSHQFYTGGNFPHPHPYPLHAGHYGFGQYHGEHAIPFGYHFHGYHSDIPLGIRHQYHTHWPHMHAAGPVIAGDPNDGMYQEPATGTMIPRPIMPQQYPVMLNPSGNLVGEDGPGVMFLGTGRNAIPVSHSDVENEIIDKHESRSDSPAAEVANQMAREFAEAAQEKQIQRTALAQKHRLMKALKLDPKN